MGHTGYTRVSASSWDAKMQPDALVPPASENEPFLPVAVQGADLWFQSREVMSPLMRIMKVWSSVRILTKPESTLRT